MERDLINETMKLLNEYQSKSLKENVDLSYFSKYSDIENEYMQPDGEGDTMASQLVTAINTIIYRYYNDGDIFTNEYELPSYADLTDFANWLYKYVPETRKILEKVVYIRDENEYEEILKALADTFFNKDILKTYEKPKQGSIYNCDGRFGYIDEDEDEDFIEDEW